MPYDNDRKKRPPLPCRGTEDNKENSLIFGRNPVTELLRSGRDVDKLYIAARDGEIGGSLPLIAALAAERGIPIVNCDRRRLDAMTGGAVHQGVVASPSAKNYASVEELIETARERGEPPLIVVCDGIEDPHNLGAIIRSADAAGAHGIIVSKRRSAPLSATCAKASAGAIEHVAVARVANIAATLDILKEYGLWIYAAESGGVSYRTTDLTGPAAIVLGGEGSGISPLIKKKCDFIISIGMYGKINSLNVSCAAAVILCEAAAARRYGR